MDPNQNPIPIESFPAPVPTAPAPIQPMRSNHPARIWAVISTLLLIIFIGLFVWAFTQYLSYKNDIQPKIDVAVDQAVKAKATELEESFQLEREQLKTNFLTNNQIANISFKYPRNWSQYLVEDERGRIQIEALFHPKAVQEEKIYALRLQVIQQPYDGVLDDYQNEIEEGELRAQPVKISNTAGIRLDGAYEKDRNGALVIFPLRDKTMVLLTESAEYLRVYNEILKSLKFTP